MIISIVTITHPLRILHTSQYIHTYDNYKLPKSPIIMAVASQSMIDPETTANIKQLQEFLGITFDPQNPFAKCTCDMLVKTSYCRCHDNVHGFVELFKTTFGINLMLLTMGQLKAFHKSFSELTMLYAKVAWTIDIDALKIIANGMLIVCNKIQNIYNIAKMMDEEQKERLCHITEKRKAIARRVRQREAVEIACETEEFNQVYPPSDDEY